MAGLRYSVLVVWLCALSLTACGEKSVAQPGAPRMVTPRADHTATLLLDGRVLVVGGRAGSETLALSEIYDPVTMQWRMLDALRSPRIRHTATLLPDGRVLVVGGEDCRAAKASCTEPAAAELFDPLSETWSLTTSRTLARQHHAATLLRDGRVLIVGGDLRPFATTLSAAPSSSVAIYDPSADTWEAAPPLPSSSFAPTALTLPDGRVLVTGVGSRHGALAFIFDPTTATWNAVIPSGTSFRAPIDPWMGLLPDGAVVFVDQQAMGRATRYDPVANLWSDLTWRERVARSAQPLQLEPVVLRDGRILLTGGKWSRPGNHGSTAESWLLDPILATWEAASTMPLARSEHRAVVLHTGDVLLTGGEQLYPGWFNHDNTYIRRLLTSVIYEVNRNAWVPTAR